MSHDIAELVEGIESFTKSANAEIAALKRTQAELQGEITELAQKSVQAYPATAAGQSFAALVTKADGFKAVLAGEAKGAHIALKSVGIDLLLKSTVTGTTAHTQTERAPGFGNDPRPGLTLLAAMPRLPVGSGKFDYVRLGSAFDDGADFQLTEGATKAEADAPMDLVTANIATVATTLPCSEQVLADQPALGQFLQNRLAYGVLRKLETELITGTAGAGKITGLIASGTAFGPSTGAATADGIGEALAHLQGIGWNPSAVLMHPTVWHTLRAERTVDDVYVAGGWSMPAAPSIWGVPVIACASMPTNKVICMDASQTVLLDRQSVTVELGWVASQFAQNLRTIRSELRAGLMVASPTAVQVITI